MHMEPFTHDAYKHAYMEDEDSKEVFRQLQGHICIEEGDSKANYHLQNGFSTSYIRFLFLKVKYCIL
jgi:hypothetical protein